MVDEGDERARAWLDTWHGMRAPEGVLAPAEGGSHRQVRALDRAAARLTLDDEPWRLKVLLAQRARR